MAWTEQMVEDLKKMWHEGLTTGEIGKRLGVSKNSIVGKVHRLQLSGRPSPIKKKRRNFRRKSRSGQTGKRRKSGTGQGQRRKASRTGKGRKIRTGCQNTGQKQPFALRQNFADRPGQPYLPLARRRPQRRKLPFLRQKSQNRPDLLRRACQHRLRQSRKEIIINDLIKKGL